MGRYLSGLTVSVAFLWIAGIDHGRVMCDRSKLPCINIDIPLADGVLPGVFTYRSMCGRRNVQSLTHALSGPF